MLKLFKNENDIEVGIDEAGRGCLFGRMYCGAVIWPTFKYTDDILMCEIRDSKKLSKKKRKKLYSYIINTAIDYAISFCDENEIDRLNINQASQKIFHKSIDKLKINPTKILVDGVNFTEYFDNNNNIIDYECIINGDNKYISIAAASILAKVAHDNYIIELCNSHLKLNLYDLRNNMGYGTEKHRNSIKKYGITKYHRKTFKNCKNKKKMST